MPLSLIALILGTFLAAWVLTWAVRRYALARKVLDVPNARSSHTRPTPRGGGVAFVIAFLLSGSFAAWAELWPKDAAVAVLGSGLIVAVTGFIDDHRHIAARWRLLAHFFAASWVLFWIGGIPPIVLFGLELGSSVMGLVIAAFFLVWMLNLYNFMDGIDGLASIEAISVCIGGALVYVFAGHAPAAVAPLLLAGAVCGFLVWNFPPARIFMGDAGSGFLGIALGVLALQAGWVEPALLWTWLIMLGIFIVDASYTLGRRLIRGERVYEAHRSHAYQVASRRFGGHLPVTLGILSLNVLWLWPIGYVAAAGILAGWIALVVAYVPLIGLAIVFQAGKPEQPVTN